jgi:predicted nucleic acid-binding protein
VVIVDANVLLYAVDLDSSHHERSSSCLDTSLAGVEAVGFARIALLAFIRWLARIARWTSGDATRCPTVLRASARS